ncbi:MAG: DUF4136 domain-containing protein [Pseudomonadota bacterium]
MNNIEMTSKSRSSARSRLVRIALPLALAAGLSACAPSFKADVQRFQSQLPAPAGETFAIVADDPALDGGLEFSLYADQVADRLTELGYSRAPAAANASLLVRFDYDVDNGRERVRTTGFGRADPFFGPGFGFRRGFGRGFGFRRNFAFGFYDPFLAGPDVRSYTVYTSEIDLKIDSTSSGERLFEGKAQALSRSNRLQKLVPNLVEALFVDFPGNSGETLRITIKNDETKVKAID